MTAQKTPTLDVYSQLQVAYDHYNQRLFKMTGEELPHCIITLQRQARTYGYFSRRRFTDHTSGVVVDEIAMNPEYFSVVPLIETLQTLVHEMAHLWQHHFGTPPDRYHDKEWAGKMEAIGLMPSHTGQPGGRRTGQKMADYIIDGGLFMQATEALMAQNFRFPWGDSRPKIRRAAETHIPPSWAALLPDEAAEIEDEDQPDLVAALYAPMPASATAGLGEGVAAPAKPRSTRQKFACATCGAAAWGSPALRLACLRHEPPVPLQAVGEVGG